ncbi:MAG: hypothetical protein H6625_07320 [Bdellovibrionaceae bacterium]|nr:hypothetical protein [Pseudobdellovibrionaceae bacterium]
MGKKYEAHLKQKELADTENKSAKKNEELAKIICSLNNILKHTLSVNDAIDWESLKTFKEFSVDPKDLNDSRQLVNYIHYAPDGKPKSYDSAAKNYEPDYEKFFKSQGWLKRTFFAEKIKKSFDQKCIDWKKHSEDVDMENKKREDLFEETLKKYETLKSNHDLEIKKKNDEVDQGKAKI